MKSICSTILMIGLCGMASAETKLIVCTLSDGKDSSTIMSAVLDDSSTQTNVSFNPFQSPCVDRADCSKAEYKKINLPTKTRLIRREDYSRIGGAEVYRIIDIDNRTLEIDATYISPGGVSGEFFNAYNHSGQCTAKGNAEGKKR